MTTTEQELTNDIPGAADWFARDAEYGPHRTHYQTCYRQHPACAWALASAQIEDARTIAVALEQELGEVQRRCQQLIADWTQTGSVLHAAQLAEALDIGDQS